MYPLIAMDESLARGRGMSDCEIVGISGGCGETCPVFKLGNCGEPQDIPDPDGIYCEHTMISVWHTEYEQSPYGGWLPAHKTHKVCTECGYKEWPK